MNLVHLFQFIDILLQQIFALDLTLCPSALKIRICRLLLQRIPSTATFKKVNTSIKAVRFVTTFFLLYQIEAKYHGSKYSFDFYHSLGDVHFQSKKTLDLCVVKPRECLNFVALRTFKNKVTLALRHTVYDVQ